MNSISRVLAGLLMTSMVLSEASAGELKFESIAEGLARSVYLTHAHDARSFVVEQPARIRVVDLAKAAVTVFLDITDRVSDSSNEQGLLSAAFHPDFAANGQFFVNYTDAKGATVVSRFRSEASGKLGDAGQASTKMLTVSCICSVTQVGFSVWRIEEGRR